MERYTQIQSVAFGETTLPLPLSVRLLRTTDPQPAYGNHEIYATSVQILRPVFIAEVRIRHSVTAETLSLGQKADLSFTATPASAEGSPRTITLSGAVVTSIDLVYEQSKMATALLRFAAEAADGNQEPFSAEASQ